MMLYKWRDEIQTVNILELCRQLAAEPRSAVSTKGDFALGMEPSRLPLSRQTVWSS